MRALYLLLEITLSLLAHMTKIQREGSKSAKAVAEGFKYKVKNLRENKSKYNGTALLPY
jgi:hypothetical protein